MTKLLLIWMMGKDPSTHLDCSKFSTKQRKELKTVCHIMQPNKLQIEEPELFNA